MCQKTEIKSRWTVSLIWRHFAQKQTDFGKTKAYEHILSRWTRLLLKCLKYMYRVRPDNFRKTWITCHRLFREVAWLNNFYSSLCLQILLLQLFPPISHLIWRSRPTVYLSGLTPSILSYSDFVKSLANAMKSLRGFRKLSRRFTMTRPWREWSFNGLSKAKYKKRPPPPPIREILTQRLPSPIWPPNWRMTGKRMSGNSLRPLTCWPERFTPLSWERRSSQRSQPGV